VAAAPREGRCSLAVSWKPAQRNTAQHSTGQQHKQDSSRQTHGVTACPGSLTNHHARDRLYKQGKVLLLVIVQVLLLVLFRVLLLVLILMHVMAGRVQQG
jgi:hypothetical protein